MSAQGVNRDEQLVRVANEVLDDGVRAYDAETRHRLRAARDAALDEVGQGAWFRLRALWLGAGALLVPLALFWVLVLSPWQAGEPGPDATAPEMLALAEEADLYRDLEFYAWLAEHQP